jgi:transposase
MFLRQSKRKDGRVYLSAARGYRDRQGKARSITVKSFGYLDELAKEHTDPLAWCKKQTEILGNAWADEQRDIVCTFKPGQMLAPKSDGTKNLGYVALSSIYSRLGLESFFNNRQRHKNLTFSLNSIVRLLIFERILHPRSRKASFEHKDLYFDTFDFSLDHIYRSLTHIASYKDALMRHLDTTIRAHYGRDTSLLYYDVTNYYFEIDGEDRLRKRGASKEHRPNPIVQMGLFMDRDGLPLSYDLWPGNAHDSQTLLPSLKKWKEKLSADKVVVVADRGINTFVNALACQLSGNGYLFGQTVRGADKNLKGYALDSEGYRKHKDGTRTKSRLYPKHMTYTAADGTTKSENIDQKQVVFYSPEYDRRAKYERERALNKAHDLIACPHKYTQATSVGAARYVKGISFNKVTGEITDGCALSFDEDKLVKQERFDGFYAIVTSELDMSDKEIVDAYRGLWEIEESFRITKSDLNTRPVFVSRHEHIQAHFLICFIALTLLRLLEKETDEKYSPARLIESLGKLNLTHLQENLWQAHYRDEVSDHIGKSLGIDFNQEIRTLKEIKTILAKSKNH